MLIVGAGGMAAQLLQDFENTDHSLTLWSEIPAKYRFIEENYQILQNDDEVRKYFAQENDKSFVLCIGNPANRKILADKFVSLGGTLSSYISPGSEVSRHTTIEEGVTVLNKVIIEAGCHLMRGCMINKTANMGHGCVLGEFVELAPAALLLGDVEIGAESFIGSRALILPKVRIGRNSTIYAGVVVRKDVPDNSLVTGESVKITRKLSEL